MKNNKRIVISTICGLFAGFFCVAGAMILFSITFPPLNLVYVLFSRMLIGFVIGISSLKLSWPAHGIVIGFIVGLPFPVYDLIIGLPSEVAIAAFIMSPIFGLLIEFFTTTVFKAERV